MEYRHRLHPGFTYHVYNRGNNRELLFREDRNYEYFLRLYQKYIAPIATTLAYCLLPDHFHFAIRLHRDTGRKDPSRCLSNLFNAYARAFNKLYGRRGTLFERPFERSPVVYPWQERRLILYVHRNPSRHRLCHFETWPHSSFHALCAGTSAIADPTTVIPLFGSLDEFVRSHSFPKLFPRR